MAAVPKSLCQKFVISSLKESQSYPAMDLQLSIKLTVLLHLIQAFEHLNHPQCWVPSTAFIPNTQCHLKLVLYNEEVSFIFLEMTIQLHSIIVLQIKCAYLEPCSLPCCGLKPSAP